MSRALDQFAILTDAKTLHESIIYNALEKQITDFHMEVVGTQKRAGNSDALRALKTLLTEFRGGLLTKLIASVDADLKKIEQEEKKKEGK